MKSKNKCQCDTQGVLNSFMVSLYDPVTELPFVAHEPNKCKGTNDMQLRKRNGKMIWLCSNCTLSSDEIVELPLRQTVFE